MRVVINILLGIVALVFLGIWYYSPQIAYFAGNYYHNNNNEENAIKYYSIALDSHRLSVGFVAKAHFGRAEANSNIAYLLGSDSDDRYYAAVVDYSRAIEITPDEPFYYRQRGTAYANLGGYNEAFADFDTIRTFEGKYPVWSLVRRGGLHRRLGEFEPALNAFDAVITAWGDTPLMPPNYHKAVTLNLMGRFDEAIGAINAGLPAQRDYFSAYSVRACSKASLGFYDGALVDYKKSVELVDSYKNSIASLSYVKHNGNIDRRAIKSLRAAIDSDGSLSKDELSLLCFGKWWLSRVEVVRERSNLLDTK